MNRISIVGFFIFISLFSCNSPKMKVDLIVSNARVYTVNADFEIAECFAVKDGKFVAIGTNQEINSAYSADSIIDCGGKPIFPGFIDAHSHFLGYGLNLMEYADLSGLSNKQAIYSRLTEHHSKSPATWILGRGWDQNLWPEKEFPDNSRLNELFPNQPVFLIRIDGHAAWCNSTALEMAEITASTKPIGGEIIVNNGQPTGILLDNAMDAVSRLIPAADHELKKKALLAAQSNCFAFGLTSVADCGLSNDNILLIDSLQRDGVIRIRVNAMMDPSEENLNYFLKNGPYLTENLQVNTIKMYADGALGSRGALLLEDYSDDKGNKGIQIKENDFYERICQQAFDANFQVATHCIGDGANRLILNIYGKFLKGKNDRRWRIEHAQVVHPDDFQLFGKYSIIPSVQATHATSDMFWADERLGSERLGTAYAYRKLLVQNSWLPNGTDFPIESINPIYTFYSSVFRKNSNGLPEKGFQIENSLSREEAIRSMTCWAARANFEEQRKGSIEPEKLADFVMLDTDLMKCNENEVVNAKVLYTYLSGDLVFGDAN